MSFSLAAAIAALRSVGQIDEADYLARTSDPRSALRRLTTDVPFGTDPAMWAHAFDTVCALRLAQRGLDVTIRYEPTDPPHGG